MKRIIVLSAGVIAFLVLASGVSAQSVEMNSAKLYKKQKEYDKAMEFFEKAIAKKPENAEAHYELGGLYGMKGRIADMVREYQASLRYDTKKKYERAINDSLRRHFSKNFNIGRDYANAENYAKALEYFANATVIMPEQPDARLNLAFVYLRMDSMLAAIKVYQELLTVKPNDYETYLRIANVYNQLVNKAKAMVSENGMVFLTPSNNPLPAINDMETKYNRIGIYGDSLREIASGFFSLIGGGKPWEFRQFSKDDYRGAFKSGEPLALLVTNKESAKEILAAGGAVEIPFNSAFWYEKSVDVLRKAIEAAPDSARPRIIADIGITYHIMGKTDEAMKTYEDALKMNPDNKNLLFNLGQLYFMRDDYPNAIKQYIEVWKSDPEAHDVNYAVGTTYLKIGERLDKRANEFEGEMLSTKSAARTKKNLSTARIDSLRQAASEHFKAAMSFLLRAVTLKPEETSTWNNLAVGYLRNGAREDAEQAFDIAGNPEAQEKLIPALEKAKAALLKAEAEREQQMANAAVLLEKLKELLVKTEEAEPEAQQEVKQEAKPPAKSPAKPPVKPQPKKVPKKP
jgi:tetratricopeptide (TPR) repeat protein